MYVHVASRALIPTRQFEIVKTFAGTNTTEATNVGNSIQGALVDSVDSNSTSGGAACRTRCYTR